MKNKRTINREFVSWDKKLEILCDRFKERSLADEIARYKEILLDRDFSSLNPRKECDDYYQLRCIEGRLFYYGVTVPSVKWDKFTIDFTHCGFVVSWLMSGSKKNWESATLTSPDFLRPMVLFVLVNAWPDIEKKIKSSLRKLEKPYKGIKPLTEEQKEKQRQEYDCKRLVVSYKKFLRRVFLKNKLEEAKSKTDLSDELKNGLRVWKSYLESDTYKQYLEMEHGFLVGDIYNLLGLPHVKKFVENDEELLKSLKESFPGFSSVFSSTENEHLIDLYSKDGVTEIKQESYNAELKMEFPKE